MSGWNAVVNAYVEFVNTPITMTFGFFVWYTIAILLSGAAVIAVVRAIKAIKEHFTDRSTDREVKEVKGFR